MNSLYVHIPFCERKCLYCSFVVAVGQKHRTDQYLDCLVREAKSYEGTQIGSIYIGGGTPTYLTEAQLGRLMDIIRGHFKFDPAAEITIEANPEGITPEKAAHLKVLGFNRISLGIQSFNEKYLKLLGRCHDAPQAGRAFEILRKAGFDNMNADLMFSFPGETLEELSRDLHAIVALGSEHVSIYALTIEENSRFYAQQIKLDQNDLLAEQYAMVVEFLENNGLRQYEISNFARQGRESVHNMNYWNGGDYIGLGVGAHSHQQGHRWWNVSRLSEYFERIKENEPVMADEEILSSEEQFLERILFGLRVNRGIDLETVESEYHCRLDPDRAELIDGMLKEGLLLKEGKFIKASLKGRLLLDEISSRLL